MRFENKVAVAPGPTDTEATRKVVPDFIRDQILSSMPLSRMRA